MSNPDAEVNQTDCYTTACQELDQALNAEDDNKKDFHIRQAFQAIRGIANPPEPEDSRKQSSD